MEEGVYFRENEGKRWGWLGRQERISAGCIGGYDFGGRVGFWGEKACLQGGGTSKSERSEGGLSSPLALRLNMRDGVFDPETRRTSPPKTLYLELGVAAG